MNSPPSHCVTVTQSDIVWLISELFDNFNLLLDEGGLLELVSYDYSDSTIVPVCDFCRLSPNPKGDEWTGLASFPSALACNACWFGTESSRKLRFLWFSKLVLPTYFKSNKTRSLLAQPYNWSQYHDTDQHYSASTLREDAAKQLPTPPFQIFTTQSEYNIPANAIDGFSPFDSHGSGDAIMIDNPLMNIGDTTIEWGGDNSASNDVMNSD